MPFVIFIGAPGMEQLKLIYNKRRATGSNKNLTFDRQSSIRFSSRRARTLESLASLYEDDDLIARWRRVHLYNENMRNISIWS
ncbi:hypothetical protein DOY81_011962 [Sarcophaga bullata]|nr:hypothetical protein DOY81_011962 [Sarcophaga bullata]